MRKCSSYATDFAGVFWFFFFLVVFFKHFGHFVSQGIGCCLFVCSFITLEHC